MIKTQQREKTEQEKKKEREEERQIMNKIKTHLSALLHYLNVEKGELYSKTGYHYGDVKTKEDLQEVIRLLDIFYYIPYYLKDTDILK